MVGGVGGVRLKQLFLRIKWPHDTQHNDIQHNNKKRDTRHNDTQRSDNDYAVCVFSAIAECLLC